MAREPLTPEERARLREYATRGWKHGDVSPETVLALLDEAEQLRARVGELEHQRDRICLLCAWEAGSNQALEIHLTLRHAAVQKDVDDLRAEVARLTAAAAARDVEEQREFDEYADLQSHGHQHAAAEITRLKGELAEAREVLADKQRITAAMDRTINGDNAAAQPALIDVQVSVERLTAERRALYAEIRRACVGDNGECFRCGTKWGRGIETHVADCPASPMAHLATKGTP